MAHRHQRHGRRFFLWEVASGRLGHTLAAPRAAEKLRGAINVMVGDSFCGRWPRDSWGTRSQLHGQLRSCAAPRAADRLRTVPCLG
jgi:hypothetical protein